MKQLIKLTEGDLHKIVESSVKKALKEGVDDNYGKAQTIMNRIEEVLNSIGKSANLISYAISPEDTAIGSGFNYNKQTVMQKLWSGILRASRSSDPNAAYTFNRVYEMVNDGEL